MATEGMNITEEAEMAERDGDKVVTMMDVLQEQQDFEEDANAVLGASDDKNCTYAKGYIKRQAIYACLTCCPDVKTDPTKRAGVCLACSLNCHESHDLVELYTKRNFRCDCGNPKFNSHPCQFTPNKTDLNNDNIYNQNFSGLYCTCQRPYPDPEATFEDDMIQCIICEDWLHASHLNAAVPANDQYSEMICKGCMDKNDFLHDYSHLAVNVEIVDIMTINGIDSVNSSLCNGDIGKQTAGPVITNGDDVDMVQERNENSTKKEVKEKYVENVTQQAEIELLEEHKNENREDTLEDKNLIGDDKLNQESDIAPDAADGRDTTTDEQMESKNESNEAATEQKDIDEQSNEEMSAKDMIEESTESLEKQEQIITSDESSHKAETSLPEQLNELPKDTGDKPECGNIEVPETSQQPLEKESIEDKTDSVMDAIDALLESNTETQDCDRTEADNSSIAKANDEETQVPKESDTCEREATENDNLSDSRDISATDSKETTNTDVEMTDSIKHNELTENENKESSADTTHMSNMENESPTETEEKSATDSNELTNGDINNIALNDTDKTNKLDSDDKSEDKFNTIDNTNENKRKLSIPEESSPKKVKLNIPKCERPKGIYKVHKGATFWPSNFRQQLCTCGECISMYKDLNVLFLTDLEDTVCYYENVGKENVDGGASQYEKGMQALSSLDRIQQINALTEYNKMRDKLLDFLKSFKERREIVKEEDIKAFFAGMKPRREPDGVYFCR